MKYNELKNFLKHAYEIDDSIIINGKHGIGKSTLIREYANENNLHCETLVLSIKDVSDLLGMPKEKEKDKELETYWIPPDWFVRIIDNAWPRKLNSEDLIFKDKEFGKKFSGIIYRKDLIKEYNDFYGTNEEDILWTGQDNVIYKYSKGSILFLDELNRALLDVRQCALQLVLDKVLHSHKLPIVNGKCTFICSAINPPDAYQTEELDTALMDRFTMITLEESLSDWINKYQDDVPKSIIDFLQENPEYFHYMDGEERGSSPRSWITVSKYIANDVYSLETLEGRLGKEVGKSLYVYLKKYKNMVTIDDIVEVVYANKDKSIIDISNQLKQINIEAMRKQKLCQNLLLASESELRDKKYNILTLSLLCFLTSINKEISLVFCRNLKKDNLELFNLLSEADEKLNEMNFFKMLANYIV